MRGFQRSPLPTPEEIKHAERLEFLGDSCLQFCITRILHREFPGEDEGVLSSVKGSIVSGASLGEVAEELGFAEAAPGAKRARLKSFLPDAFEAFLGALFLHSGIEAVQGVVERLFTERTRDMVRSRAFKSLKSMIQEIAARELGTDPTYRFQRVAGDNRYRAFVVLKGQRVAQGTGGSKKEAEDKALERLFPRLNEVLAKLGLPKGRKARKGGRARGGQKARKPERQRPARRKPAAEKPKEAPKEKPEGKGDKPARKPRRRRRPKRDESSGGDKPVKAEKKPADKKQGWTRFGPGGG